MGFFSKDVVACNICGEDVKTRGGKLRTTDGIICVECNKAIIEKREQREAAKKQANELARAAFVESRVVGGRPAWLHIDDSNKLCYFTGIISKGFRVEKVDGNIFKFDDIDYCEMNEDGETLASVTKSGVGRALVGGALFGAVGAVVGAQTGKERIASKAIVNNVTIHVQFKGGRGSVRCTLMEIPGEQGGEHHTRAIKIGKNIVSALEGVINADAEALPSSQKGAAADLRELKSLMDEGIITKEEFDAKKKQMLGL